MTDCQPEIAQISPTRTENSAGVLETLEIPERGWLLGSCEMTLAATVLRNFTSCKGWFWRGTELLAAAARGRARHGVPGTLTAAAGPPSATGLQDQEGTAQMTQPGVCQQGEEHPRGMSHFFRLSPPLLAKTRQFQAGC